DQSVASGYSSAVIGGVQPPTGYCASYAPVSCGAIRLWGNHIRVRRIRCINFGTQNFIECFGIHVVAPPGPNQDQSVDNVVEDCIFEQPAFNNTHESSLIYVGYTDASIGGSHFFLPVRAGFGRGCVSRNNYINSEYQADPIQI